jgi:hypothetical protein
MAKIKAVEDFRCEGSNQWDTAQGYGDTEDDALREVRYSENQACLAVGAAVAETRNLNYENPPVLKPPPPRWGLWAAFPKLWSSTGVATSAWGPNRLDVFAIRADNHLMHMSYDGDNGWSKNPPWDDLGAAGVGTPAAASWGDHHISAFMVGTDGQIYHKPYNWYKANDWADNFKVEVPSAWTATGVAASAWGPNRLDVFAIRADNQHLMHTWYDGGNGWSNGWEDRSQQCVPSPAAASWSVNHISLFVEGTDGQIWSQWFWNFPTKENR